MDRASAPGPGRDERPVSPAPALRAAADDLDGPPFDETDPWHEAELRVSFPGDHSGPAAGFGHHMAFDEAPPSTVLAGLADEASGDDRAFQQVTDNELMGLMGARHRLIALQSWERLMAIAEFIRRRPSPGCPPEGPAKDATGLVHTCGD